jgi:hypothetical protein
MRVLGKLFSSQNIGSLHEGMDSEKLIGRGALADLVSKNSSKVFENY